MPLFDEKIRKQLKGIFNNLLEPINLVFFTQEFECYPCSDVHAFVNELSSLSDKIKLSVYDFQKDKALADKFGVDKIPAIVINDKDNSYRGIKYYGLPGGYEINSLLQTMIEVSGRKEPLPEPIASRIASIDKNVHIQVYVTLTCPFCPTAVGMAHRLALENKKIQADMIDSSLFPYLVQKYQVSSVPMIIINETHVMVGAQPMESVLDIIKNL
jgi:glutaredoxin-like protein